MDLKNVEIYTFISTWPTISSEDLQEPSKDLKFNRQRSKMQIKVNHKKVSRNLKCHYYKTLPYHTTCLYLKTVLNFTSERPRQPPKHNS